MDVRVIPTSMRRRWGDRVSSWGSRGSYACSGDGRASAAPTTAIGSPGTRSPGSARAAAKPLEERRETQRARGRFSPNPAASCGPTGGLPD